MLKGILYAIKNSLKKPFKVGIVSYHYPEGEKGNNGVAVHVYYLSRELAKLGCEVHVFTKGEKETEETEYINEGKLVIHKIVTKSKSIISDPVVKKRVSYFMFDNKIIDEISKENSHEKFDVIHTHGWLTAGAFITKFFHDLKWVHTFHALEKNRIQFMTNEEKKFFKIANWMEGTIRHADALITVSKKIKIEVLQNYSLKSEKIFPIYNGVDLEMFYPPESTPKEKKVLYVGRFSLEKGIDLLYNIAKKTLEKDKEIIFEIVASKEGIPRSLEKLKDKFESLEKDFPERLIWHKEKMGRKELSKLYKEAILYIQPSRYDSCPTTVLEAMASGKAVIGSDRGGIPEILENSGVVTPLKSNLFQKNILELKENYKLRERYARRALERVKDFQWEKIGNKTLKLYKKITEKKEVQASL